MKDYKEITESVFRKSEERLALKKQRAAVIRRTVFAVSGICAAFIVAFGVLTNDSIRNGKKNDFDSSNLITESTLTSSAESVENFSMTTTAAQLSDKTYTEISASTTTAVPSSGIMSTPSNAEDLTAQPVSTTKSSQITSGVQTTSVTVIQEINRSTTAPQITTAAAYAETTSVSITTTALHAVTTSTGRNTTSAMAPETTVPDELEVPVTTRVTSTVAVIMTTTTVTYTNRNELSPLPIPWDEKTLCQKFKSFVIEEVQESVETTTVRRVYSSNNSIIAPENIEDFVASIEFMGTEITEDGTQIEHKISGNIYTVKNFSEYAVLAVRFEGDSVYYYYYNSKYKPQALSDMVT